jgi:hypothetical protein
LTNKNIIKSTILSLIVLIFTGRIAMTNGNNMLIQLFVFPTGLNVECYIVSLSEVGTYNVKYGNRDLNKNDVLSEVKKEKTIALDNTTFKKIEKLVRQFDAMKSISKNHILKGGWELVIKTQNNTTHIYYNEIDKYDQIIKDIVKMLMDSSPIEINIHSWS